MNVRTRRIVFPIAAVAAVLVLASTLSKVLSPVVVAMLLAVILNPLVELAARFRLPRVATVGLLYVALVVLAVWSPAELGSQFRSLTQVLAGEPFLEDVDGNGLIDGARRGERAEFLDLNGSGAWDGGVLVALRRWVNTERTRFAGTAWGDVVEEFGTGLLDLLDQLTVPAGGVFASSLDRAAGWAGGFVPLATLGALIPFYLFFFLVEYPRIRSRLHGLVPPRYREQVDRIARDIGTELVAFLRGRLLCGLGKALFLFIGLMVLGLPFALPIALVTGLLSLVPFLGFLAGVVPAAGVAVTMPGGGLESLLLVIGLFVAAEAFEGAVLFPLILGKETGLHPVTIVVVLLAGGSLLGTVGVLVAIPLALVVKVLWREIGVRFYTAWADPEAAEAVEAREAAEGA